MGKDIILDNIFKKIIYWLGWIFIIILFFGFTKGIIEGLNLI